VSNQRRRWLAWVVVAGLLGLGAFLRFHQIKQQSQWPDEFWSVYLSTGRGGEIFHLPTGKLLDPPPKAMLEGAPAWPHIWTSMVNAVHPPVYHIVLRWWMDVAGESDTATRGLSALLSLAGVVILFDAVRRSVGMGAGLAAAAMMTLAVSQIDLSQQTRSYTLLALWGLIACHAMVRIEIDGARLSSLIELVIAVFAALLTHYLAGGALVGLGIYALIRLRGPDRRKTVGAMVLAALLAAGAWGPWLWRQRPLLSSDYSWMMEDQAGRDLPLQRALSVPALHLYGHCSTLAAVAVAIVVYLLPILLIRQSPQRLLWWLLTVGMVASTAVRDATAHTLLNAFPRYTFIAAPAICALAALPLPFQSWRGWRRWLLSAAMVLSVAVAAAMRVQEGPPDYGDWRGFCRQIDRLAGERDPIIFSPNPYWGSPAFWYLALAHYVPDSRRPIMMLDMPAEAAALRQLAGYRQIWLIGAIGLPPSHWLPGWTPQGIVVGAAQVGYLQRMVPATSAPISPAPSPPATQSRAP